jgi:hypothetical protein
MLPMISADRGNLSNSDGADVAAALHGRINTPAHIAARRFGRPLYTLSMSAAANV